MVESSSAAVGAPPLDKHATDVRAPVPAKGIWPRRVPSQWRYVLLRRFLACADVAAALLATVSLVVIGMGDAGQLAWGLFYLPIWIVVAKLLGLYDRDGRSFRHLTAHEIPQIVLWALVGTSGLSLFLELMPPGGPDASSALVAGSVATVTAIALRATARWLWRLITPRERVAIVGPAANSSAVKRKLELFPDMHMEIVEEHAGLDVFGRSDDGWLTTVDRVILAPRSLEERYVRRIIEIARGFGLMLSIVPPSPVAFAGTARLSHVADLPVLEYKISDLSRSTLLLKRALDLLVSVGALIVLAPFFLVIAVAIKIDSSGPAFYSQWRAGRGGRSFRMHKFRSMVPNAEDLLPLLIRVDELPEPVFKLECDPRTTRVGRWLRRWSFDELPQLLNVLRGEMSLVGPRPEQVELVERYSPEQRTRLKVTPGMSGPMQVYGRGDLSYDERLIVERDYVENLSIGRDLEILFLTLGAVLRRRGAY
jgi:exopolysaccharide biosynthesis polyprenyl glycosylphosphotransferase